MKQYNWTYFRDEWGLYQIIPDIENPQGCIGGEFASEEDAKRVVECVNACNGIEDPAAYIADLEAQIDLAVRALEVIERRIKTYPQADNNRFVHSLAFDTLTKIKGGEDDNR